MCVFYMVLCHEKPTEAFILNYLTKAILLEATYKIKQDTSTKVRDEDLIIPQVGTISLLFDHNFSITQLKSIIRHHKLKRTGTKPQLRTRIFTYLHFSRCIIMVQKLFRGRLQRTSNALRGPGFLNRDKCLNANDFITLVGIQCIDPYQFVSFVDNDNFIYGCDIASLYNFINLNPSAEHNYNPYNRSSLPITLVHTLKRICILSTILNKPIRLHLEEDEVEHPITTKQLLSQKSFEVFQNMNQFGYFSSNEWFLSLSTYNTRRFFLELVDMWEYRLNILYENKVEICPSNNGNPFFNVSTMLLNGGGDLYELKLHLLKMIEVFVNSGVNHASRSLGTMYVLAALTIVNQSAAESLPWLYNSVNYQ